MRVIIISDIHGNYNNLVQVLNNNKFDMIYILGDIINGPYSNHKEEIVKLLNAYKDKLICIRGNNDYESHLYKFPLEDYRTTFIDGKRFFLTHGHIYNKYNKPNIDYDVFIQGHTHKSSMYIEDNKLYLNPGSISLPRDGNKSFIIYDNNKFSLYTIDNILLKEITF